MVLRHLQSTSVRRRVNIDARGGNENPATTVYGTGPPSSTYTQYRGIKSPEIAGSTGGFIGLVAGIAVVVLLGVFVGIYFYNRHHRRLPPSKRSFRSALPALFSTQPSSDPYADPLPGLDDNAATPPGSGFGLGLGMGRPAYTRQRSSEWEMPNDVQPNHTNGKGKSRDMGYGELRMPSEPDEAAYPLRSRSPRPLSPRIPSSEYIGGGNSMGKMKSRSPDPSHQEMAVNPFESELDPGLLSPPIGGQPRPGASGGGEDERHIYLQPGVFTGEGDQSSRDFGRASYTEVRYEEPDET